MHPRNSSLRPTDRLVLMAEVTEEHPEVDSQWAHSELAKEAA